MKIISFFLCAIFVTISGYSQVEFQKSSPRMLAYKDLPKDEKIESVQKNFLSQTWRTGIVYSKNNLKTFELPLIFDVYSNKLYFLKDSFIMEFTEPVKQFMIPIVANEDTIEVLYRSGYPPIHKNTDETFYEVLVDGNFQLLKCKAKTIALYKDKDIPEEDRDYSKELLYASLPNGHIVLIKTDKDFLLKEMPDYAEAIQTISSSKKMKLKNEAQIKELFLALNGK